MFYCRFQYNDYFCADKLIMEYWIFSNLHFKYIKVWIKTKQEKSLGLQ